ncbi:MAG: response regulator [Phycisphaeraceae bacterium]|nr:MAG: response regulator [Phycisphaeraceae bacterium]
MPNAPLNRPPAPGREAGVGVHTVLVVSGDERVTTTLDDLLRPIGGRIERAGTAEEALRLTEGLWYDVVLVDEQLGCGALPMCERMRARREGPSVVLYTERASLELATRAMRSGVDDLLSREDSAAEFIDRIRLAIATSATRRKSLEREVRLKRLCSKLDRAHREVTGQVGELCTDLAGAYKDLSEQIGDLSIAGELNGLLRQELDIESLLRVFLEYLLARVGSTNAGVFLPNSVGEYTLGAYINYDRPKESAEPMLESMAGVIAPVFENEVDVVRLSKPSHVRERLGEHGAWLEDQAVLAVGCHDQPGDPQSECLAVLCLFRDRRMPFSMQTARTVQIAAELFGRQMARVIQVHHRHIPQDLWGEDDIDDIDLAA